MNPNKIFRIFLGYVSFVIFGGVLLSFKLLADFSNCEQSTPNQAIHPHEIGRVHIDPWNVNDHPVSYAHGQAYNKEKRDAVRFQPQPLISANKETKNIIQIMNGNEKAQAPGPDANNDNNIVYSPHHLAVIVPFRDRFEELQEFVPHMHRYLTRKGISHKIYIVNQADKHRFNRASLINVGFLVARNESNDYIVMHDVDLLPLNNDLNYGYPDNGPFHIAAPHLHPKYHYPKFVGGILVLSVEQFEQVNGLSNKFWGWGREDDELYMRMTEAGYQIQRHGMEITTGYNTFRHEHDAVKRPRDYKRLFGQKKASFKRDHETGFHNVEFKIAKRYELTIDSSPCTILNVVLFCDKIATPWCDFPSKHHR
ncbi:beta-1,4-galactosyltransferase 7-like [Rhopilema esculentum]|uniref:beta-1,4-galactosyltransferase 7-like n=1 Tax=Rhopilema esculentum TaxID=499914 RepID=UPI0031D8CFC5|eukprot:gene12449-3118_t